MGGSKIEQVKTLREMTGIGLADAMKALDVAGGDLDKAVALVRQWEAEQNKK